MAEAVSKLEIRRFSGVALPFPRFREADRGRSGGSTSSLNDSGARFDTASADYCPMQGAVVDPCAAYGTAVPGIQRSSELNVVRQFIRAGHLLRRLRGRLGVGIESHRYQVVQVGQRQQQPARGQRRDDVPTEVVAVLTADINCGRRKNVTVGFGTRGHQVFIVLRNASLAGIAEKPVVDIYRPAP
jgi:hypothetical protein